MNETQFYLDQAEICAAAARDAELAQVRDKYLTAEKRWRELAAGPRVMAAAWKPAS